MKKWILRIISMVFFTAVIATVAVFILVKLTLSETSIAVLEEKTQKNYDPYSTVLPEVTLEDGSVVNQEEIKNFFLFSADRRVFSEVQSRLRDGGALVPLDGGNNLLQVNQKISFKNLLSNDCKEIYCYQHYLPFDYIPSIFWKGLIGVEDQRYLDHFGVDLKSLFRALVANLKSMRYAQGGSTISQQLVKNLFFTNEKKFSRKIKEMIVSIYVETQFPKEKILEAYLNEVHWGALQGLKIKGVYAASLIYFGKKPEEITPFEGAILIGLLKGPGFFHPLRNLDRLKERTDVVYKKLVQENFVPDDQSLIWTNADWSRWTARLKTMEKQRYHHSLWRSMNDPDPQLTSYEKFVLIQKVANVKTKIGERFDSKFNTNDISVKVLLGSIDSPNWYSYYSRIERNKEKAISQERHQIGSTIKPIIYGVFQDNGKSLNDEVLTNEITLTLKSGEWTPREAHYGLDGYVSLGEALLKSYNRPVVRIAQEIGFPQVEEGLKAYFPTLKSPLGEYPSELLGSVEQSVSELRDSYAKFITTECRKIKSGERDLDDNVLYLLSDPNQSTVYRAVDAVMQKVRFFGKTGTTNNGYDNWYLAFDGKNITVVWVGYEGERSTNSLGLYGSTTAFDVFQNFYRDRGKRFHQFGCELIN